MKSVLAAALLALASIPITTVYDGMPPQRYQASSVSTVRYVPEPNAEGACGISSQGVFLACVRNGVTILPNPCKFGDTEKFAKLACHEAAHKQGWPGTHGP